jgi:hypothetical protein
MGFERESTLPIVVHEQTDQVDLASNFVSDNYLFSKYCDEVQYIDN